jgi:GT2 family glycosyltransferase
MKYSIVIISKDNRKYLINCLENLIKNIPKDTEIIVVEAGKNLENLPFGNVKHIKVSLYVHEAGFSNQRNIGVKNSNGEYIIFIDDDVEVTNNWFKNLTSVTEDEKIIGAMGSTFPIPKNSNTISFNIGVLGHPGGGFRLHNFSKMNIIPLSQIASCNTIIKKEVIENVGCFDLKNFHGGEDTDLSIRITQKYGTNQLKYIPNALAWHYTKTNFLDMCKWYLRRGKADAELFLKHTGHFKYLISTAISLKILTVIILSSLFSWIILPLAFIIWYFLQMFRARFMWKYFYLYNFSFTRKLITFFVFPFIKLTADIMFDFGRILRLFNKQNSKI